VIERPTSASFRGPGEGFHSCHQRGQSGQYLRARAAPGTPASEPIGTEMLGDRTYRSRPPTLMFRSGATDVLWIMAGGVVGMRLSATADAPPLAGRQTICPCSATKCPKAKPSAPGLRRRLSGKRSRGCVFCRPTGERVPAASPLHLMPPSKTNELTLSRSAVRVHATGPLRPRGPCGDPVRRCPRIRSSEHHTALWPHPPIHLQIATRNQKPLALKRVGDQGAGARPPLKD